MQHQIDDLTSSMILRSPSLLDCLPLMDGLVLSCPGRQKVPSKRPILMKSCGNISLSMPGDETVHNIFDRFEVKQQDIRMCSIR